MKASGIGGQAVMEGIMMKNGETYAVAVRKPDNEIIVKQDVDHSYQKHEKIRKIPFIRGMFNFVDSLVLGMSTLTYSAEFYEEDEEPSKLDLFLARILGGFGEKVIMGATVALSIILAVAIFMVCPFLLAKLFERVIVSQLVLSLVEGLIRVGILLGYIWLISKIEDIQRVFMYHGAEHKCINCIENGMELNVENVMKSSKEHKRCGTSFLLVVMLVSIIFFLFIRVDSMWLRLGLRILLVPVIAGVSYEFIRLAGKSESKIVNILSKPGMMLQGLTTKEPDETMVEVAIKAVEAVFDWRAFLEEYKAENADMAKAVNENKDVDMAKNSAKSTGKNKNQGKNAKKNKKGKNLSLDKKAESESVASQMMADGEVAIKAEVGAATKATGVNDSAKLAVDINAIIKAEGKTAGAGVDVVAKVQEKDVTAPISARAEDVKTAVVDTNTTTKAEEEKDTTAKTVEKAGAKEADASSNIVVDTDSNIVANAGTKATDAVENAEMKTVDTSSSTVAKAKAKTAGTSTVAKAEAKTMDTDSNIVTKTEATTADTNTLVQEEDAIIPEYTQREKKEPETKMVTASPVPEDNGIKAPRLTFVDDSEPGVIKLHWDKVKKVNGYVIYRKTEDEVYKMYPEVKKNYFEDREIEKGVTYYYRVRAYVIKNNKRIYGQMSLVESNGYNARVKSKY